MTGPSSQPPLPPASGEAITFRRHDDLEARLLARRRTEIELVLADADDLYVLDRDAHFISRSCSNIQEYGERVLRMSARDAALRLAIGRALQVVPDLRERLLAGRMTPENAASLGMLLPIAHLVRDLPGWVEKASQQTAKTFRRAVDKALREAQIQQPTVEVALPLSRQGLANLEDAQALMSKAEGRKVTKAETVERTVDEWLDRHDPRRRGLGTRRMPLTRGSESRTVPASVKRAVLDDAGGVCEIDFCDDSIVELAHLKAHAEGGDREKQNLGCLCGRHHTMFDQGLLSVEIVGGERIWRGADGEVLGRRRVRDAGPDRTYVRPRHGTPGKRGWRKVPTPRGDPPAAPTTGPP